MIGNEIRLYRSFVFVFLLIGIASLCFLGCRYNDEPTQDSCVYLSQDEWDAYYERAKIILNDAPRLERYLRGEAPDFEVGTPPRFFGYTSGINILGDDVAPKNRVYVQVSVKIKGVNNYIEPRATVVFDNSSGEVCSVYFVEKYGVIAY